MTLEERVDYFKKEVVERVIFRDIPEITKIKNPNLTVRLLTFSSYETGNIISFQNLSQKLGARFETISEYLFYLESSFLITLLKKFSRGGLTIAKSQPKICVNDSSLILALTGKKDIIFGEKEFLGRLIESMVVSHLRFSLDKDAIFFWRDERGEVDIIVNLGKNVLPIEVKFKNKFERSDFTTIYRFQKKFGTKKSLTLTEDFFSQEEGKIFIPVWLFLGGKIVG
jgi:predicted AAA+ superfamily ATPase